ncbi:MAG: 16S rRNA (guanine(527)-N(7))-methyltransferase RsmG [Clostridium sp.]|jgi:16S rRNA (guanine527-N7)-methyltransferase|uniref:16S rRNA (guanine(527)-N(7))-methyltransferase RsmG n=1 Tax=Clostridium sp. TaxID=1506 RepID=UPI0025C0CB63|nr:16S rRNA (guanine(527)-N(7))-methyltransferase RsmG [Clostridium sp.]MCH3965493.1 16S rRNA (guanine(527)-N(7))-methyltransferase RsmG [Clostridium sp.]MCI1716822.1 16S rRNA (guanine(527)-N(7))-methyltransferase RsmG [Clostridium sp.]MCI1801248.1 16S rRNA (guanine(527)-N(7))-methyltransferase RsmG [Clostridium sp.]MCI1815008.1 16S rRNA (guanine(527)-N(7))-methyltransferase RsmG [Clostridium sp.]MCI1871909.1 16S rRNA (guanine(527)-N(7))-methyltransferase RsmG [Clostridium sp.]
MDYFNVMEKACLDVGVDFNLQKYNKFIKYKNLLQMWNKKINLTTISEDSEIIKKHFIDCINVFKFDPLKSALNFIDVGTGAGFPGIPMSIIRPEANFVLLDSLNKRINFLNQVLCELNLHKVYAVHGRAEDMARKNEYRECFDAAVSRAVGNLAILSELCIPYIKVNGYFVALKGPSVQDEIKESENSIALLGGKLEDIIKIEDSELRHNLVIIKKVKTTSVKYPRRSGVISKKPLK